MLTALAFAVPTGDEPQMMEYSDGYFTRLKIHKWASYLTVPLFVGEYIVGTQLINGTGTDNTRAITSTVRGRLPPWLRRPRSSSTWNARPEVWAM